MIRPPLQRGVDVFGEPAVERLGYGAEVKAKGGLGEVIPPLTRPPTARGEMASDMKNGVGKTPFDARSWASVWAGYAACIWAFTFAAVSFYWAAGGTAGADMIGPGITEPVLAREPTWVAILWVTGILKVLAGLLALALVRPWGSSVPRWLLLTAAWGAGALLILYGGAGLIEAGLMEAGVIGIPASMGLAAVRWKLMLWQPFWLLGGALFLMAAWHYGRRS